VIVRAFFWALWGGTCVRKRDSNFFRGDWRQPQGGMTHRLPETLSDQDFRNLARLISACTLGLWAFAAGLLIGTFLFSWSQIRARDRVRDRSPLGRQKYSAAAVGLCSRRSSWRRGTEAPRATAFQLPVLSLPADFLQTSCRGFPSLRNWP